MSVNETVWAKNLRHILTSSRRTHQDSMGHLWAEGAGAQPQAATGEGHPWDRAQPGAGVWTLISRQSLLLCLRHAWFVCFFFQDESILDSDVNRTLLEKPPWDPVPVLTAERDTVMVKNRSSFQGITVLTFAYISLGFFLPIVLFVSIVLSSFSLWLFLLCSQMSIISLV